MKSTICVQLDTLVGVYQNNYTILLSEVSRDVAPVHNFIHNATSALSSEEILVFVTEKHLWLIPTVLLVSALSTVLAIFGPFLAQRHEVNKTFAHFFSFWLPSLMILLSMTCWTTAMGGSVATAISVDACLAGSQSGSPHDTIEGLLTAHGAHSSDPIYRYISAYTSKCSYSEDPSTYIMEMQDKVQNLTDFMQRTLVEIDKIGLGNLSTNCKGKDGFDFFLSGTQDVTRYLTNIERALEGMVVALSCERVNELYDDAVNQSICSDAASSIAWGFIIL
jgi:hypothetical protein